MPDAVGVICNAGVCDNVDPTSALVIVAIDALLAELKKKEPFGPNNDIVKALQKAQGDLLNGTGPNNDIVKALSNAWSDLTQGFGENNDIRKALGVIGIKF